MPWRRSGTAFARASAPRPPPPAAERAGRSPSLASLRLPPPEPFLGLQPPLLRGPGGPGGPARPLHPGHPGEHAPEPLQRRRAVPELAPTLGRGDHHPRGQVDDADRRGRLVPVLPAWPASDEGRHLALAKERVVVEGQSGPCRLSPER